MKYPRPEEAPEDVHRRREQLRDYRLAGPPKLKLHLWRRVQMLLLLNIIPFALVSYFAWKYYRGEIGLRGLETPRLALTLGAIVVACVLLAVTTWVALPLARWLRDYPNWFYQRRSRLLWFLPATLGWAAYLLTWLLTAAAGIAAVSVVVLGLIELFAQGEAVQAAALLLSSG